MSHEVDPRCEHGCSWRDHDLNCICMRDCGRCGERCRGPHGVDLYERQQQRLPR